MAEETERPTCFGRLDQVFPLGPEGLRQVNADCQACIEVKACLGLASRSPEIVLERASRMENSASGSGGASSSGGGLSGFLKRWSELKKARIESGAKKNKPE